MVVQAPRLASCVRLLQNISVKRLTPVSDDLRPRWGTALWLARLLRLRQSRFFALHFATRPSSCLTSSFADSLRLTRLPSLRS